MNWPTTNGGHPAYPLPAWPELDRILEEFDEFDWPEPQATEQEEVQ
jgi:hypothetical protein